MKGKSKDGTENGMKEGILCLKLDIIKTCLMVWYYEKNLNFLKRKVLQWIYGIY